MLEEGTSLNNHHYDPEIHHRKSLRLPAYNYSSAGAYFVTICLQGNQPYLEDPQLRHILEETWNTLPQHFPGVVLDEFVMMADHIHFILWLEHIGKNRPTLGDVLKVYKSLTSRAALNYLRTKGRPVGSQFWQRSFHDRVIRNETELQQKREYIRNNPIKDDLKHNRL
jgi:REP element-mobilizing transposase RayT